MKGRNREKHLDHSHQEICVTGGPTVLYVD